MKIVDVMKKVLIRLLDIWIFMNAVFFLIGIRWFFYGSLEMFPTEEQIEKDKIAAAFLSILCFGVGVLLVTCRVRLGRKWRDVVKRKVRTISVNNQKFVWWYGINEHVTTVNISPFHDKTSIISIKFTNISTYSDGGAYRNIWQMYLGTCNESIVMSKDGMQDCVKIVTPKMAGLLLSYLITKNDLFVTRKNVILNGYDVLLQMGYQIIEVKKGVYW